MSQSLIDDRGRPRYGLFDTPPDLVNAADFDWRTPMDRPRARWRRRFGYNQFQFIGLCAPELVIGCAIVDLKLVGNAFFYLYFPPSGELFEISRLQPLARRTHLVLTPDRGRAAFAARGLSLVIDAEQAPRRRRLQVDLGRLGRLDAVLTEPPAFKPLALCSRAGYSGWVYTQKAAGLPVSGSLQFRGRDYALDTGTVFGNYDWSCGFMRRHTFWNWACCSGRLPDGCRFGLNLAAGVNETGYSENVVWLGDTFLKVDAVDFSFDRLNPTEPWRMRSFDGRVDLVFRPEGLRREKIHAGLLASNFKQVFGRFEGTVRAADGEPVAVNHLYGFCEDHYALW